MRKTAIALSFIVIALTSAFVGVSVQSPSINHQSSGTQTVEERALACLTDVYPVDLNHYNVSLQSCDTLPSPPSDNSTTQAVNYMLNSPNSNLVANFLFKDAALYSLSLQILNGSVAAARSYATLTDAARDFLVRYQAFSGVDSSELIHALDNFDEAKGAPVVLGNISLSHSHLVIPNAVNATTFHWIYTNDVSVTLSFDKGIFYNLFDCRQLEAHAERLQVEVRVFG